MKTMLSMRGKEEPLPPTSSALQDDLIDWSIPLAKTRALPAPFDLDEGSMARVDAVLEATVQAWALSFTRRLKGDAIANFMRPTSPLTKAFNEEEYRPFLRELTGETRLNTIAATLLARLQRDSDEISNLRKQCLLKAQKEHVSLKDDEKPPEKLGDKQLMEYEPFQGKITGEDGAITPLKELLSVPSEDGDSGLPRMLAAYITRLDAFILFCYASILDEAPLNKLRECAAIAQLGIHGYSSVLNELIRALATPGDEHVSFAATMVSHTLNYKCKGLVAALLAKNDVKKFIAEARIGDLKKVARSARTDEKADVKKLPAAAKVRKIIARSLLGALLPEAAFAKCLKAVRTRILFHGTEVTQETVGKYLLTILGEYGSTLKADTEHGRFVRYLEWAIQKPFAAGGIVGESARLAQTMASNVEVAQGLLHSMDIEEDAANEVLARVGRHYACLERVFDEKEMKSLLEKLTAAHG